MGPLSRVFELLPAHILRVTERETPIPTIAQRAHDAQQAGTGIIRCDIGQIVGVREQDEVLYGPPLGLPAMRSAIAELYNMSFALETPLTQDNVAVCSGAAEGLSILFRCFGHDKNVGVQCGHWENYRNGVDAAAGRAVVLELFDDAGKLDADRLAHQIRDLEVAMMVTNFPCNPTGAVLDREETATLARVIRDTGIVVIADEVYARLRYDGVPPQTLLEHAPDHVISLGSASKEYLLPGARVGYVVSRHRELISRLMGRLLRANTASPNVLGQRLLLDRMNPDLAEMRAGNPPPLLETIQDEMKRRRNALAAVLTRHGMSPEGRPAAGTIFAMASLPSWWDGDDVSFSERALDGNYFSSIPGSAFGLAGAVRLSFGALTTEQIAVLDDRLTAMRDEVASASSG